MRVLLDKVSAFTDQNLVTLPIDFFSVGMLNVDSNPFQVMTRLVK